MKCETFSGLLCCSTVGPVPVPWSDLEDLPGPKSNDNRFLPAPLLMTVVGCGWRIGKLKREKSRPTSGKWGRKGKPELLGSWFLFFVRDRFGVNYFYVRLNFKERPPQNQNRDFWENEKIAMANLQNRNGHFVIPGNWIRPSLGKGMGKPQSHRVSSAHSV